MLSFAVPASAEGVQIAQATSDENSDIKGGKAGDQTGDEVSISSWTYGNSKNSPFHWEYVIRAKDPVVSKKLAECMKLAAENNYIGYDQNSPDRYTFFYEAERANWDISAIRTNCETTCSSAISVCVNAVGIKVPKSTYSGAMYDDLMSTGEFEVYKTDDYIASQEKLLAGDILIAPEKHAAMVVESPNKYWYSVEYFDENGKSEILEVEDGTKIILFPNNGKQPEELLVTGNINLESRNPEKLSGKFLGWEKKDNNFIAKYESHLLPLKITGKKKPIQSP